MRPQELNLLMVFDAIMTERSITRAAERLSMTQPAVSNAVSRMRVAWKDELFVKDGRNIQPTLHAQNLWSQIREPLGRLSDAIEPSAFDPVTSNRTFRLAAADIVVDIAWRPLRQLIEKEAPGINIHAVPYVNSNNDELLFNANADLVIGGSESLDSTIRSQYLFSPQFVCVMRQGHPLAKADLGLEEFAAADHLLVSLSGDTTGITDQLLLEKGLSRRIAFTVNHFSAIAPLIQESDMIAVVPSGAVEKAILEKKLAVTKPPLEIPPSQTSMMWHKRQDRDGGLIWLRHHIKKIMVEEVERHNMALLSCLCKRNVADCSQAEKNIAARGVH